MNVAQDEGAAHLRCAIKARGEARVSHAKVNACCAKVFRSVLRLSRSFTEVPYTAINTTKIALVDNVNLYGLVP
jgi:hypothetical protein